jgi:hypothetical protein
MSRVPLRPPLASGTGPGLGAASSASAGSSSKSGKSGLKSKLKRAGKKVRQQLQRRAPSIDVFPWSSFFVCQARARISGTATVILIFILCVAVLWFANLVPALPPAPLQYCAFYYFVLIPFYVMNRFLPEYSLVTEFYTIALCINIGALVMIVWISFTLLYYFYQCSAGQLAPGCGNAYLMNSILCILTFFIAFNALSAFLGYLDVVSFTGQSNAPNVVHLRPINEADDQDQDGDYDEDDQDDQDQTGR